MNNELCLEINDTAFYGLTVEFLHKDAVLSNKSYYIKDEDELKNFLTSLNTRQKFNDCILSCVASDENFGITLDISTKELLLESLQLLKANNAWCNTIFGKPKIVSDIIKLLQDNSEVYENKSMNDIIYERFVTNVLWFLENDINHTFISYLCEDRTSYETNELSLYIKGCPNSTHFNPLFRDPKAFREYLFNCAAYLGCKCPAELLNEFGEYKFKKINYTFKFKNITKRLNEKEKEKEKLEKEIDELKEQLMKLKKGEIKNDND